MALGFIEAILHDGASPVNYENDLLGKVKRLGL